MKIKLYFINWNDSYYLPFIKKHYGEFCQRIVMYDNHSTDNSVRLAKSLGFEVRPFGTRGELNDQTYLDIKNHCWKEERTLSDYVIVCDADEFLVIDILKGTAPAVRGYNMISDHLPVNDIFEVNTGEESEGYSKQIIFSPSHIKEINFVHGCHRNNMTGMVLKAGACRLFHFRQIGGIDRLIGRHYEYRKRMSTFNKRHRMGFHYLHDDSARREEWKVLQESARKIF